MDRMVGQGDADGKASLARGGGGSLFALIFMTKSPRAQGEDGIWGTKFKPSVPSRTRSKLKPRL